MSRYTEPRNSFCLQMSGAKLVIFVHTTKFLYNIDHIFLTFDLARMIFLL